MRSAYVTAAIVLRCWPFGESDKIVSFFTETHGKITGIAKGAKRSRKRFVNTLEPFSLVNLRFEDRAHSTLAFVHACDLIRPFNGLTTSLEKIALACYLMEITDGLTGEREENRLVFQHLRDGLIYLEENEISLTFLTFFELRLLKLSGYQPMLEQCRRCRTKWPPGSQVKCRFSPRDGGVLCESCSHFRKEAVPLSVEALHTLLDLQKSDSLLSDELAPFPLSPLREGRSVLLRFIQFQMNKALKSLPFLDSFSFT